MSLFARRRGSDGRATTERGNDGTRDGSKKNPASSRREGFPPRTGNDRHHHHRRESSRTSRKRRGNKRYRCVPVDDRAFAMHAKVEYKKNRIEPLVARSRERRTDDDDDDDDGTNVPFVGRTDTRLDRTTNGNGPEHVSVRLSEKRVLVFESHTVNRTHFEISRSSGAFGGMKWFKNFALDSDPFSRVTNRQKPTHFFQKQTRVCRGSDRKKERSRKSARVASGPYFAGPDSSIVPMY